MPAISASAPGKIILFGEHAVVYGQPAIAVPVEQVQARAFVTADPRGTPGSIHVQAPEIDLDGPLAQLPLDDALSRAVSGVLGALEISRPPAFKLRVTSTIPLAAGLGSGAAVSVAVIRAVSAFLGHPLPDEQVSALAFEVEKLHHGTPSGIDNTVVTFSRPVYYIRGEPIRTLELPRPFTILIADTGVVAPTSLTVGDVRAGWQAEPQRYETLFAQIGEIARQAHDLIANGETDALGPLMDENQSLLEQLGVSSPQLENLIAAARAAGALGAKLSGGGRGGNMIALVKPDQAAGLAMKLEEAGAKSTIITTVEGTGARERGGKGEL